MSTQSTANSGKPQGIPHDIPDSHKVVRVAADFYPGHIQEPHRESYRLRALALRKVSKLSNKGLREDAERIRMFEQEFDSLAEARPAFIEAFKAVNTVFGVPDYSQ